MYRKKREQTYFTITGLLSYDPTLFDNLNLPNSLDKDTAVTEILMTCGLMECAYPDGDVMKQIINVWSFARKPDWQRMIDALYGEYNPLHNYDRTEDSTGSGTSTGQKGVQGTGQFTETEHIDDVNERNEDTTELRTDNLTDKRTPDITTTRTDNLTDKRTPNITNQRTDNLSETKSGGETTTHQNTAFNAGLSDTSKDILTRNADTTANTGTQTNVESGQESTTHTGTQTTKETGDETTTHTGTVNTHTESEITDDRDVDRTKIGSNSNTETTNEIGSQTNTSHLYARGNIGVMSTQDLIRQELSIRYEFNIYEIIAREFKEKFCNLVYIL